MSKKETIHRRKAEEHIFLGIHVSGFEAKSEASLNLALQYGHSPFTRSDDLAFEYATNIEISGVCRSPPKRNGEKFHITLTGRELHPGQHSLELKDFQARDKGDAPQYKRHRGEWVPVYDSPPGLSRLERERGTGLWRGWLSLPPNLVSDMLIILARGGPLYLSLHEFKSRRARWIKSLSLTTNLPDEEDS